MYTENSIKYKYHSAKVTSNQFMFEMKGTWKQTKVYEVLILRNRMYWMNALFVFDRPRDEKTTFNSFSLIKPTLKRPKGSMNFKVVQAYRSSEIVIKHEMGQLKLIKKSCWPFVRIKSKCLVFVFQKVILLAFRFFVRSSIFIPMWTQSYGSSCTC